MNKSTYRAMYKVTYKFMYQGTYLLQRLGALAVVVLCVLPIEAELYKYVNGDGVTVLDSHVPAEHIQGGYTILSLDGRVIEVVPRALTAEEILERDRLLELKLERRRLAREKKLADQNLLRIYAKPEDVIRARDAKMASVEGFINTSKGQLARLQTQERLLQAQLADIERAGGIINQDRLSQITTIEVRIVKAEKEIESKRQDRAELLASFASDLKRVRELYESPKARR